MYNGLDCWATITGTFERTIVAPLVYTGGVATDAGVVGPGAAAAAAAAAAPRWQFGAPDLSDRGRIRLSLGPPV